MGVAEALGALVSETPRRLNAPTPKRLDAQTPGRLSVETAKRPGVKTAKNSDPDFAKKTLYVRKATMRDAMRKYEDQGGEEESELVEMLLRKFVGG